MQFGLADTLAVQIQSVGTVFVLDTNDAGFTANGEVTTGNKRILDGHMALVRTAHINNTVVRNLQTLRSSLLMIGHIQSHMVLSIQYHHRVLLHIIIIKWIGFDRFHRQLPSAVFPDGDLTFHILDLKIILFTGTNDQAARCLHLCGIQTILIQKNDMIHTLSSCLIHAGSCLISYCDYKTCKTRNQ